jgi:hypothetical protein
MDTSSNGNALCLFIVLNSVGMLRWGATHFGSSEVNEQCVVFISRSGMGTDRVLWRCTVISGLEMCPERAGSRSPFCGHCSVSRDHCVLLQQRRRCGPCWEKSGSTDFGTHRDEGTLQSSFRSREVRGERAESFEGMRPFGN